MPDPFGRSNTPRGCRLRRAQLFLPSLATVRILRAWSGLLARRLPGGRAVGIVDQLQDIIQAETKRPPGTKQHHDRNPALVRPLVERRRLQPKDARCLPNIEQPVLGVIIAAAGSQRAFLAPAPLLITTVDGASARHRFG